MATRSEATAVSWYDATERPRPSRPPLLGDRRADVAIVGGGYAGLSAALHLAEAGLDVVLLEARSLGWGASGRNGGQLSCGPRVEITRYERLVGRDDAAKIWEIGVAANRLVRDLIARHAIACDLTDGHLEAAWKPAEVAGFRRYADHLARHYGYDGLSVLDEASLRARVDSPHYRGALADAAGGHLHPLDYLGGLAAAAQAAGAELHETTPVRRLLPDGVETATGTVRADWVIVACNAYLEGLDTGAAARMMPIQSYMVATGPLGERAPVRGGACVCDTRFALNYFRMSPDGRLLFGGGETYGGPAPADIARFVLKPMLRVFPQLADARLDYGWGGAVAITRHRAPLFRRDGRRLVIGGWSGAGIHMATMGGRIAAEAVRGTLGRWDVLARVPCPAFPGGPRLRPALLALALTWFALRDRL